MFRFDNKCFNSLLYIEAGVTKRGYENMEMAVNLESLIPATRSAGYSDMGGRTRCHANSTEPVHTYEEILEQPAYENHN